MECQRVVPSLLVILILCTRLPWKMGVIRNVVECFVVVVPKMGQIISSIWRWICPKKKNKTINNIRRQSDYQPLSVDEDHFTSHLIDIPDTAASVSTPENVGKPEINLDDGVVVYLSSEYQPEINLDDYQTISISVDEDHFTSHHIDITNTAAQPEINLDDYQTIFVDEDHLTSHHIDVPDTASCVSTTENVGKPEINLDDSVVVDLSNEYEEVAEKRKRTKNKKKGPNISDNGYQSTVSEAVFEKSVTTSIRLYHHHLQVVSSVKKIGQYTSGQRLLLVGDGDFSFSACLAIAFGTSATNIVATSLNSQDFLMKNYGNFINNKAELRSKGSMVLHDVDATKMVKHQVIGSMVFDRIIFNFPHVGSFGHSDNELRAHQKLIREFLRNAKKMIGEDGEIHITSKSNGFYLDWDIPNIGRDRSLNLIEEIKFSRNKYPGYRTKYGFGGDRNFHCNPSKTYKFGLQF